LTSIVVHVQIVSEYIKHVYMVSKYVDYDSGVKIKINILKKLFDFIST
jgi:hypothetical protein